MHAMPLCSPASAGRSKWMQHVHVDDHLQITAGAALHTIARVFGQHKTLSGNRYHFSWMNNWSVWRWIPTSTSLLQTQPIWLRIAFVFDYCKMGRKLLVENERSLLVLSITRSHPTIFHWFRSKRTGWLNAKKRVYLCMHCTVASTEPVHTPVDIISNRLVMKFNNPKHFKIFVSHSF